MRKIIIVLIVGILLSCNQTKRPNCEFDLTTCKHIENMSVYIDSAIVLYNKVDNLNTNGQLTFELLQSYNEKLTSIRNVVASNFDSITDKYKEGVISERQYKDLMRSNNLDSLKLIRNKLINSGVEIQ